LESAAAATSHRANRRRRHVAARFGVPINLDRSIDQGYVWRLRYVWMAGRIIATRVLIYTVYCIC
jgi:hypothetical protein